MIFDIEQFRVELAEAADVKDIAAVYNSNTDFLVKHISKERISESWILEEMESIKAIGFFSCKIIDSNMGRIAGILDFGPGEETYLSLLMLHNDYKNKGCGGLIYKAFEKYLKSAGSSSIRIDVVTGYDNSVLDFWSKNGFVHQKEIELNWDGKTLPAVVMKKVL